MSDLLPCPFCGSKAELQEGTQRQHWVECCNHKCRSMGANCEGPLGAAEAWNTRQPAPSGNGEREQWLIEGARLGLGQCRKDGAQWVYTNDDLARQIVRDYLATAHPIVEAAESVPACRNLHRGDACPNCGSKLVNVAEAYPSAKHHKKTLHCPNCERMATECQVCPSIHGKPAATDGGE